MSVPSSPRIIESLLTRKSCMRGYGGFLSGIFRADSYRFCRMQIYGTLNEDGTIIPNSNWPIGNEGGATWGTIEQFLVDCASMGVVPNLSFWLHNFEFHAEVYRDTGNYSGLTTFFQQLKSLMNQYGVKEMIMEPAWEFNGGYWPVSPAQQRNARIEPDLYAYGMEAIRTARDLANVNCSIVSHILALHGDKWFDPERETWKRTYAASWFAGMKYADVVTTSLYLKESEFDPANWNLVKGPLPANWYEYLDWIYTYVVGLQKIETGWAPAKYVGFSEHNIVPEQSDLEIYTHDFNLFDSSGCSLMGWWLPFTDENVHNKVEALAMQLQGKTAIDPKIILIGLGGVVLGSIFLKK